MRSVNVSADAYKYKQNHVVKVNSAMNTFSNMDCKILELRPDRNLLKNNFDGYKLSLEHVAIIKEALQVMPDRVHQSEIQYGFLHAQLFSLQNHLIHDPWTSDTCYYIDTNWTVKRVQYNLQEGRFKPIMSVFRSKKTSERLPGHFNLTMVFISEKFAAIGDGTAWIEIVDTGDRTKCQEWKQVLHIRVLPDEKSGFVLKDARLEIQQESRYIHCLLMRVEQAEGVFESVLEWIAIDLGGKVVKLRRELRSKSSIYYSAFTSNLSGVIVSAGKTVKFTNDSENPIIEEDNQSKAQNIDYTWKQTEEDVVITFNEREGAEKTNFYVKSTAQEICVKYKDEILIEGDIFGRIDVDLTTWNLQNNTFQVTLMKAVEGERWLHLVPEGPLEDIGEKIDEMVEDATENQTGISSLDTQMEDCDRGDEDAEYFVAKFDGGSHKVTHKANLGSCSPLFSIPLRPGQPAALALRQDVDCCLWLPCQMPSEWLLRHEGTLDAFAYVLASKQQRKYVSCSPDMSYAVICEPERHVFIYKSKYDTAAGLRKRSGPQVTLGQQKVVSLEDAGGQVIGMTVLNEVTLLLTEKFILCLQINTEQ